MSSKPSKPVPAIHWIGAGLASGPGIVSLAHKWGHVTVWDMVLDRAEVLKKQISQDKILTMRPLNLNDDASRAEFCTSLNDGDIIVSMLPADFHTNVAKLALSNNCHMVTSSYLTEEMLQLNNDALKKGLSLVNEVGLDPGIDHLFTHILIDSAQNARVLGQGFDIDFISYCGGFPVKKTPFTYKFSWTPLGVLTALTNPAKMIKDGKELTVMKAWDNVTELSLEGEVFEAYANRDSLPYITEYGLNKERKLRTFVRGTLRLSGWKKAWKDIFASLENASPEDLNKLSDQLWHSHQYKNDEQDRVVLHVALSATSQEGKIWKAALSLDSTGSGWQSAMANCVSLTVAEAVNSLMEARLTPGVQSAPHDISEAKIWLKGLMQNGIEIRAENIDLCRN